MSTINLGTSSWNFDEWRGVFYPEKLAKKHYLAHYARHFNSVEVNTSFYALPRPSMLINWVDTVPAGFTFALKFPRAISHEKRLVNCESETLAFLDALHALGVVAGPGFLQLPPDFTRAQNGRMLATYLDWLTDQIDGLRIAVEVRADDLLTPAFAAFVAERGMALALTDRWVREDNPAPDMAPAWLELVAQNKTPPFAFLRWIGNNPKGPWSDPAQRNREFVAPRDVQLDRWAQRIVTLWQAGIHVFGYMHNPYEGYSPTSVERLRARLAPNVPLPEWPPTGWHAAPPDQLSLFDAQT